MTSRVDRRRAFPIIALLGWAACSGHAASSDGPDGGDDADPPVTISGTVRGLVGTGLVLALGDERLPIAADGAFTFAAPLPRGTSYEVSVSAQPTGPTQRCTVTGGSGTTGATSVTDVDVACSTSAFTVGGTVEGLAGTGLRLRNNGGDEIAASGTAFVFPTPVASGATYSVTVAQQPSASPPQVCTVSAGSGTVGGADVTSVTVSCATARFTIGGTVSGRAGSGLVIQNNFSDDLAVGNGAFAFATPIASGDPYAVTIKTQPSKPAQVCTVTNGSGTVGTINVSGIDVRCVTSQFSIGGTVKGLAAGDTLTLLDNGADALAITANGGFMFATQVPAGQTYAVTVASVTGPVAQSCTVANASSTVPDAPVTNVTVTCAAK